mgnify:CR=1 FL=1
MNILDKLLLKLFNFLNIIIKTPKSIQYHIFDYFFVNRILKKRVNFDFNQKKIINDFFYKGFCKINNFKNFSKKVSEEINKQNPKLINHQKKFEITEQIKIETQEFCNNELRLLINDLNLFYGSNIFLGGIKISRNYDHDDSSDVYANKYHIDNNRLTLFKLFILLSDVDENTGPTHIIEIKNNKRFVQETNYKSRSNYFENKNSNMVYKNVGKFGDSLLCTTSRCFHRAGVVKNGYTRDMLTLTFVAYPKEVENYDIFHFLKNNDNQNQDWIFNKLSKSNSIIENFIVFFKYLNNIKLKKI